MELNFSVTNQKIKYVSNLYIIEKSRNYLTAKFSFSGSEWKNVVKTAIFKKDDTVINVLLDENGRCEVPWEVITKGTLKVSVFGGDLVTVDTADVKILKSGYEEGNAPSEPTSDVYSQILAELQSIRKDFVTEEMLGQAVEDWLADNVIEALSPEDVRKIVYDYLDTHMEEIKGEKGDNGEDGKDGTSITVVSSEKVDGTTTVILSDGTVITIEDGTNGKDGVNGEDGKDGVDGTSVTITSLEKVGDVTTIVFSDGSTMEITDGADGKDGVDGNLGTVSVKTGSFNLRGDGSPYLGTLVSVPIQSPEFTRNNEGMYLCVGSASWSIYTSEDLTSGAWNQIQPSGINAALADIAFCKASGYYYLLDVQGCIWYTQDLTIWNILNWSVEGAPIALCEDGNNIYVTFDSEYLGVIESAWPNEVNIISGFPANVADVTKAHGIYILQGGNAEFAVISDTGNTIVKTDGITEENLDMHKIVYWNGCLFGLNYNSGELFMANARFADELLSSNWVLLNIDCVYKQDEQHSEVDTKIDIFVSDDKLYIVGNYGIYRLSIDLSIINMCSERINTNAFPGNTRVLYVEGDELLYLIGNECVLFTQEYTELDIAVAVQQLYNGVTVTEVNVSGGIAFPTDEEGNTDYGTAGQLLVSNGDGTFSWISIAVAEGGAY